METAEATEEPAGRQLKSKSSPDKWLLSRERTLGEEPGEQRKVARASIHSFIFSSIHPFIHWFNDSRIHGFTDSRAHFADLMGLSDFFKHLEMQI